MKKNTAAFTLAETLMAAAIGLLLFALVLVPYLALQKGFNFAMTWSDSRNAQTRLLDCMARDLRNATAVSTSGSLPLILTIPDRYGAYEKAGSFTGEPQNTATLGGLLINTTTGKVAYSSPGIMVIYEQNGSDIKRRVTQTGVSPDVTRTIASFSGGVSIAFKNLGGASFSSEDTIVPSVSATINSVSPSRAPITTVMTDIVFLRGAVYK